MNPEILQYGFGGFLLVTLTAIGVYLTYEQRRRAETDKAERADRATANQWLRTLVEANRDEQKETVAKLSELVQTSTAVQQQTVSALVDLERTINDRSVACEKAHEQIRAAIHL